MRNSTSVISSRWGRATGSELVMTLRPSLGRHDRVGGAKSPIARRRWGLCIAKSGPNRIRSHGLRIRSPTNSRSPSTSLRRRTRPGKREQLASSSLSVARGRKGDVMQGAKRAITMSHQRRLEGHAAIQRTGATDGGEQSRRIPRPRSAARRPNRAHIERRERPGLRSTDLVRPGLSGASLRDTNG